LLHIVSISLVEKLKTYDYTALTAGGYQWLRKALHPAESTIKAPRCPSHGIRPTATQETVSTWVLNPPPAVEGSPDATWSARIAIKNDPLCPVEIMSQRDVAGANPQQVTVLNQAFCPSDVNVVGTHVGTQFERVRKLFSDACEQYRQTSLSLTGVFVGATLSDQGSIIAAQMSDPGNICTMIPDSNGVPDSYSFAPRVYDIAQALPGSDQLVLGTTPFVISAKEGFYMPMKMENPECWKRTDENYYVCRSLNTVAGVTTWGADTIQYPVGNGLNATMPRPWLKPVDDGLGVIWLVGLAQTTSFRLTLRVSVEMMTRPSSTFATFCEPPALPDDHAIGMYYEIVSRMKDAYPARDNDLGTLWQKIKNIAGGVWDMVSPALANTPLAPIVPAVNVTRSLMRTLSRRRGNGTASVAPTPREKEVSQMVIEATSKGPSSKKKKKGGRGKKSPAASNPAGVAMNSAASSLERAVAVDEAKPKRQLRIVRPGGKVISG
jgi:hypothetical protein